jgi:hypothetical protein
MHYTLGLVVIPFFFPKYRGAVAYSLKLSDYAFLYMITKCLLAPVLLIKF